MQSVKYHIRAASIDSRSLEYFFSTRKYKIVYRKYIIYLIIIIERAQALFFHEIVFYRVFQ